MRGKTGRLTGEVEILKKIAFKNAGICVRAFYCSTDCAMFPLFSAGFCQSDVRSRTIIYTKGKVRMTGFSSY